MIEHNGEQQQDVGDKQGDVASVEPPCEGDASPPERPQPSRSLLQWCRDTFFGTEPRRIGSLGFIGSALVALVLALIFSSGDGGRRERIVVDGRTTASAALSPPKNAVEEIAQRPIWSSPPATYSEANKALEEEQPDLLPAHTLEPLKEGPSAESPAELAEGTPETSSSVLVLGRIASVETVTSRFIGEQTVSEVESGTTHLRPVVQIELMGNRSADVYAEFVPDGADEAKPGVIVVILGRVAAIGETHNEHVRSAYLLVKKIEVIPESDELDSRSMRRLFAEASRSRTSVPGQ